MSNMATYLINSSLHKGDIIQDIDLNRADPNDSDGKVLSGCHVIANNIGIHLNRKEMNSLHSHIKVRTLVVFVQLFY